MTLFSKFRVLLLFVLALVFVTFPLHPQASDSVGEAVIFATVTPEEAEQVVDSPVGENLPEGLSLETLLQYLPLDELLANVGSSYTTSIFIFAISFVGVALTFGIGLYRSVPAHMLTLLTRLESVVADKQAEASKNKIDWDDPLWAEFYESVKSKRKQVEEVKNALDGLPTEVPKPSL